jgi:hypothetical protein
LIEAKVLLPGATVLARAVASARDRAAPRLHRTPSDATTGEQKRSLEQRGTATLLSALWQLELDATHNALIVPDLSLAPKPDRALEQLGSQFDGASLWRAW